MSVEQHCAKEQHKPLSAPLLRTVKSLCYSFVSTPKSFMQLLSGIIFLKPQSFPFLLGKEQQNSLLSHILWLMVFISSPGSSCSSLDATPWTSSSTCGQGSALRWNWAHRQLTELKSLLIDEWPKTATHRVQGEHMYTYSCVTQGLLIEPFPAIPPPDTDFKLSLYTAIFFPRIPHLPNVPGHLHVRKAWHGCHRHIPVTVLLRGKLFPSPSALEIPCPDISNGCC